MATRARGNIADTVSVVDANGDRDEGVTHLPTGKPKSIPLEKRAAVWVACGGTCTYCGTPMNPFRTFTIDHVIPRSRGGTHALENLVGACRNCNQEKGDQMPLAPPDAK